MYNLPGNKHSQQHGGRKESRQSWTHQSDSTLVADNSLDQLGERLKENE